MKIVKTLIFAVCLFACNSNQVNPAPPAIDAQSIIKEESTKVDRFKVYQQKLLKLQQSRPIKIETRSDAEIAAAACVGHCASAKIRAAAQPLIPASWTVPAWYIDPANVSTHASDSNNCTTALTPCLTYAEIAQHRWQTYAPRLQQSVTITWMSSIADNSDPVYLDALEESGAIVTLQGQLTANQQVCTGTLSNVTAKNRATASLLVASLCGTPANEQLIVNTTHASKAWVYSIVEGATVQVSQPCAIAGLPTVSGCSEINTWANGDTFTLYNPVSINVGHIKPTVSDDSTFGPSVIINNLHIQDIGGLGLDTDSMGCGVSLVESSDDRIVAMDSTTTSLECLNWIQNAFIQDGITSVTGESQLGNAPSPNITAGVLGSPSAPFGLVQVALQSGFLDGDVIIGGPALTISGVNAVLAGAVYVDTGVTLNAFQAFDDFQADVAAVLWGGGTFNVGSRCRAVFGGSAASSLLISNVRMNNGTVACSVGTGAPATWNCGITVNKTNLDAALGATGFGGIAIAPAGGSIIMNSSSP